MAADAYDVVDPTIHPNLPDLKQVVEPAASQMVTSGTGISMVYVTIDSNEAADKLIQILLERQKVACANKIK